MAAAVGLVAAPGTYSAFGSGIADTSNKFSSGDVLLSDTIGGTVCTSSGTTISSNSANCPTNPAPTGLLPAAGTTTAKSWTLAAPGTLLSSVRAAATCGVQAVADSAGSNTGIVHKTVGYGAAGPAGGTALSFTQSSSAYASTVNAIANPQSFSIVVEGYWTAATAGTLISFDSSPDTTVGTIDRALWVTSNKLYWGVNPGTLKTVSATVTANAWHQIVAVIGSGGQVLYVDGAKVASAAGTTTAGNYTGYWHLGWGAQSTWTNGPSNSYFSGSLADVAIIPTQLTAANVTTLYGSATNSALQTAISALSPSAFWHLDDPAATYYNGSVPGLAQTPCSMVEATVGTLTGSTNACALPAGSGACPAPSTSTTLATWAASSVAVPGLTAGGTQTVTVTLARGTVLSGAVGLHVGGTVTLTAASGGFSATLVHGFGTVDL